MLSMIQRFIRWDPILFSIIFLLSARIFFTLPPISLYSNDEGAKYIQMKNFVLNNSLAIKYPGQKFGLDFNHFLPFKDLVSFVPRGDKMYCVYPPLFPFLSSLFYPLLGDRVTHFLPLLAYFLSLLILSRILGVLVKNKLLYYLLQLTFLIGSPIFIYAFTFWEHVPAVFVVICSLYFWVQYCYRKPSAFYIIFSSFILGSAAFFRTEIFFLMAAYTISLGSILFNHRQFKAMALLILGQMVPLIGYGIFNLINYQNIVGLHIGFNMPLIRFSILRTIIPFGLTFGCIILAFLVRRDSIEYAKKEEIYSYIPILWLGLMFKILSGSPILNLFLSFPAVFLIFIGISKRMTGFQQKDIAFGNALLATIILYICLIAIFFYQYIDLSVRFCLPIIPFVIIFIAAEHKRIFIARSIYWVLIAFLLFSTGFGLYNLKNDVLRFKWHNAKRIEFLKRYIPDDSIVIFQDQGLMEHAGPLFYEHIYLVADTPEEYFKIFKGKGFNHCFYMTPYPDIERFQYFHGLKSDIIKTRYDFKFEGVPNLYLFKVIL